jgi:hypothetical protein
LQAIAYQSLANGFRLAKPGVILSDAGYVGCIDDNLLPTVSRAQFEDDLRKGDGNELESKFLAVHSSSALGVNCFAPFKVEKRARELSLAGITEFEAITFEKKCPTGLRRGKPPNLDLVCESRITVVAVESKCTEYLATRASRPFSTAYSTEILDDRRSGPWFALMKTISKGEVKFLHLDVPQLIKHAFGLAHCFRGMPTILPYVFWEPTNASEFPIFAKHREETRRLQETVNGGFPQFSSVSYFELWNSWASRSEVPAWLIEHITNLRKRYEVPLASSGNHTVIRP